MTRYRVGYFVGSLASDSINRKLAAALVRLAPSNMEFTEIPSRISALQPRLRRCVSGRSAGTKGGHNLSRRSAVRHARVQPRPSRIAKERHRLGKPPVGNQLAVTEAVGHHRRIDREARHSDRAAEPPQRPQLLQRASDECPGGLPPVHPRSHHRRRRSHKRRHGGLPPQLHV